MLQLFPNGGTTDIVFVTLFCIAVGTAIARCGGRCAMPNGHCLNILLFWRRSTAALVFRVAACFEVSLFCPPFPHSSPSLIGLLASVDVKQQSLSLLQLSLTNILPFEHQETNKTKTKHQEKEKTPHAPPNNNNKHIETSKKQNKTTTKKQTTTATNKQTQNS